MRRRGEEEQATDIKSNNPHLAGGEKCKFDCVDMGISYKTPSFSTPKAV